MTFTREQLQQIIETDHVQCGDAAALARELLESRADAEPVAWPEIPFTYNQLVGMHGKDFANGYIRGWERKCRSVKMKGPLYTRPQPAPVVVPEEYLRKLLPDAEKAEFWFEHDSNVLFEGIKFNDAVLEACRAAMLQGKAEPVSQPYTLPEGYALVPIEPTSAILDEFDSIIDYGAEDSKDAWCRLLASAWVKSPPAAPKQEAE